MSLWVVVEYEQVDVREWQDPGPRYVPGAPDQAMIIDADNEAQAIGRVATRSGHFAAFPLPDLVPRKATLMVEDVA